MNELRDIDPAAAGMNSSSYNSIQFSKTIFNSDVKESLNLRLKFVYSPIHIYAIQRVYGCGADWMMTLSITCIQYETNIYRIYMADTIAPLAWSMDQNGRKHNHSLINSKPKQRYFRIELKHT